ncbi:MAG: hypothetical protein IPJ19_16925 [Planctomycetes bacterium]|nr:hypothetical protein [Planctomycetota bacterium]
MQLTPEAFAKIRETLYQVSGIKLETGKEELVKARLIKVLNKLDLADFESYLEHVKRDTSGEELKHMVDVLTTNKTSFYRENEHFEYVKRTIAPVLSTANGPLRIWCAGCSSGEEPYTLSMVLNDCLPAGRYAQLQILATDISQRVLSTARAAEYSEELAAELPEVVRRKHFEKLPPGKVRVRAELRKRISFARLNLMGPWPMRGPFDAIFCRNVMIYFDKPTQESLVNRYYALIRPGGHMFVSRTESLAGVQHPFEYIEPGVYRR